MPQWCEDGMSETAPWPERATRPVCRIRVAGLLAPKSEKLSSALLVMSDPQ